MMINQETKTLPILSLQCCIPCREPIPGAGVVGEEEPAYFVMTDFQLTIPVTVEQNVGIDDALQLMKDKGVRFLLVTDKQVESFDIAGTITSYDIQGEKPIRYAAEWKIKHSQIDVGMIMTPLEQTPGIDFNFVQHSRVRHIIETLRRLERHHALVIESDEHNQWQIIRGLFSVTHIGRMIGYNIHQPLHATHIFSEMRQSRA